MFKIFKINYKNNNFLSKKQFLENINIYNYYKNELNNFLLKKKLNINNKFELIDMLLDLPEFEKNYFSNILGGYINHDFYHKNISFNKNNCFGEILEKIIFTYNSYENFKFNFIENFKNFIGWGWLIINNDKICMVKTFENNNPMFPLELGGFNSIPILCINLHENSYFIDYGFYKKKYINLFLENINWYEIENRLQNFILNK